MNQKSCLLRILWNLSIAGLSVSLFSCSKSPEMTLEEINAYRANNRNSLVENTVSRPWKDDGWVDGVVGGTWQATASGDPKSFNLLIAERDGSTSAILNDLYDYLVDYNVVKKEWVPNIASFEIKTDVARGTLDLYYTLRDDLYWSYYKNSSPRVKVTSDDVIFWYDEIQGDETMGSSAYNGQFMELDDGSVERITINRVDDRTFYFHFPRIVAEPLLHTNMNFGPRFLYKAAKDAGGAQGVKDLFIVETDPRTIPSMGPFFIVEYTPGQRIVYERNHDYWKKDSSGNGTPYYEREIARIVDNSNTQYLLFQQGNAETYTPSPEQLSSVVMDADNAFDSEGNYIAKKKGYTVFNAKGNMGAPFWTFNQNPKNKDKPYYNWFVCKEFRQAMSCLLNRDRIIAQTYRGLAEPKYNFFPEANAYYNPDIALEYRFDHARAKELLAKSGFKKESDGFLYDSAGNKVEFDLTITSSSTIYNDIAQIVADECKQEGITVNVRQVEFQKIVEQMTATYDWQSLFMGFGGSTIFPSQGSNVWLSSGNLHLWYPLQQKPATDWEARVDKLYSEASCIVEHEKAAPLWNEYQKILLEQCPIIYLVRGRSFFAIQNRWNLSNVYYDNINGAEIRNIFTLE